MKKLLMPIIFLSTNIMWAQKSENDSITSKNIQAVNITKKAISKKSDRTVFDVANSPIAKGSTAYNVLLETPMISSSSDESSLKILGKSNAVIYINGRKSTMNIEAVIEMLKGMPAENISKIEVITVPGSEFNVEGNDGVINIILKKKPDDGTSGSVKFTDTQGFFNSPSLAANVRYRSGKFYMDTNLNSSYRGRAQFYNLENGSSETNKTSSEGYVNTLRNALGGYLNMEYEFNDKNTLSFGYNTMNMKGEAKSNLFNTRIFGNSTSYFNTLNNSEDSCRNHSLNLNYLWLTDDKGSSLNINSAFLYYKRNEDKNYSSYLSNNSRENIEKEAADHQNIPQKIYNYATQVDFVKKISDKQSFSTGLNYNFTQTDNNTVFTNIYPVQELDERQTNHFQYNENILGMYITYENQFSEKISGKLGVRFEGTYADGKVLNKTGYDFTRNNNNFLPYLNLNYNINKDHNLTYAFSSRIGRPTFWELNPATIYLTSYNYVQNNPFAKAFTSYNQELNYMFKNSYFIVLSHNYIQDASTQVPLQKIVTINEGNNTSEVTKIGYIRTNYGFQQSVNVSLGLRKAFYKGIWNVNYSTNFGYNVFRGSISQDPVSKEIYPTYVVDRNGVSFSVQMNNTIRLSSKKDWYLTANYFYQAPQNIEVGIMDTLTSLDLGIKKTTPKWTFSLQVDDVFDTFRLSFKETQKNGYYNNVNNNIFKRQVTLGITYNFGNSKLKTMKEVESANTSIKTRT